MFTDVDSTSSLQNRRLRLRNAHVHGTPLTYGHRRGHSGASSLIPPTPKRVGSLEGEDNGWETDGPPSPDADGEGGSPDSLTRRRNRDSMFSTTSTLLNTPDQSQMRFSSNASSRTSSPTARSPFAHSYRLRTRASDDGPEESRYIEYLEGQLAELVGKLQEYTSPASGSNHAAKLRKLTAENRVLRNEVADWETNFNIRVNEEAASRYSGDKTLRAEIKSLELKLEDADERIRIAKLENKDLRNRIEELKGVYEENRALEVRLEALTELLADSARNFQNMPLASPTITMTPDMITTTNKTTNPAPVHKRANSMGMLSSPSGSQRSTENSICDIEDYGISDSIDSLIYAFDSPSNVSNRPQSAGGVVRMSTKASFAPSIPISPPETAPSFGARRMRRFPSGSSAPKTLILPSAAVVTSPTLPSFRSVPHSPDLSRPGTSSSIGTTTTQSVRPRAEHRNSLFAELSLVDHSFLANGEAAETTVAGSPSATSPVEKHWPEPPSPTFSDTFSDTFSAVADAISHPTPLIVKVVTSVGEGIASPTSTFFSAKRRAMEIVGRVGEGVGRVTNRRAKLLSTKSRRDHRGRRVLPAIPSASSVHTPALCVECGNTTTNATSAFPFPGGFPSMDAESIVSPFSSVRSRRPRRQASSIFTADIVGTAARPPSPSNMALQKSRAIEDSIENVWLWVRFVVAIVVALGVAVKDGPGVVLSSDHDTGDEDYVDHIREEEREIALKRLNGR